MNIEKNNEEVNEKGTELPERQKNRLTINLENKENKKKTENYNFKKDDDNKNSNNNISTGTPKNCQAEIENKNNFIKEINYINNNKINEKEENGSPLI